MDDLIDLAHGRVIIAAAAATPRHFTLCAFPADRELTSSALGGRLTIKWYTTGPGKSDPVTVLQPSAVVATRALGSQLLPVTVPRLSAPVYLSNYTWEIKLIGNGASTASNFVSSWVLEGGECDAIAGPAYSQLAIAMSPVVNGARTAWVDTSTSAVLSNKQEHPSHSRSFPTSADALLTFGALLKHFNWRDMNTLCIDDAYARGAVSAMAATVAASNGTVYVARCLTKSLTEADVASFMTFLEATSPSRVLFIAGLQGSALDTIIAYLARERYDKKYIFIFADICLVGTFNYTSLQSAVCVMSSYNIAAAVPLRVGYETRDTTADKALLATFPRWNVTNFDYTLFTFGIAFSHDALLHAMRALAFSDVTGIDRTVAVRAITTDGFSGRIILDPMTGDRQGIALQVFNAQGGRQLPICIVDPSGHIQFQEPTGAPTAGNQTPPLVLLAKSIPRGGAVPNGLFPVEPSSSPSALLPALLGGLGAVLLGMVGVGVFFALHARSKKSSKDNSNAPKDSTKPFAIVFTDIQASTALWARVPEQMSEAVDVHHATIRRLIARHHGYEVKTIGDSFMVAFHDAKAALEFCVNVQLELYEAPWNTKHIDTAYQELGQEDYERVSGKKRLSPQRSQRSPQSPNELKLLDLSDHDQNGSRRGEGPMYSVAPLPSSSPPAQSPAHAATDSSAPEAPVVSFPTPSSGILDRTASAVAVSEYSRLWRGLRVRAVVHYGLGKIQEDPVSTGFDYYGTVVNTAARVEGAAHGGQVLATHETLLAAGAVTGDSNAVVLEGVVGADLGLHTLRGLEEDVHLYQLSLPRFADRIFPALLLRRNAPFVITRADQPRDDLDLDSNAPSLRPADGKSADVSSDPDFALISIAAAHVRRCSVPPPLPTHRNTVASVQVGSTPLNPLAGNHPATGNTSNKQDGSNKQESTSMGSEEAGGTTARPAEGPSKETTPLVNGWTPAGALVAGIPHQVEGSNGSGTSGSAGAQPFKSIVPSIRRQQQRSDELLQCAFFLRTVLSTIPADRRKAMLRDIAIRWHVCPPERVGGRLDPSFNERAIVSTAWRVLETMKARPLQQRRPSFTSGNTTSGRVF